MLCPDFSSETKAGAALNVGEFGVLGDMSDSYGNYMAFIVRGRTVNTTYTE